MGCKCVKYLDNNNVPVTENGDIELIEHVNNDHSNTDFSIPDKDGETSFSQILHCVHRFIWKGNFSSPVEGRLIAGNARILNVRCGEGAWLLDNASRFKWSNFFGCDVAINFQTNISQLNSSFVKADILDRLPYDKNTFDFVYLQFGSFTENEWQEIVVKELVRVCKPGGWVEIMDCENKFYNQGETTLRLEKAYQIYLESKQINPQISQRFEEFLRNTNQVGKIQSQERECTLGNKGGRAGKYLLQDIMTTWQRPRAVISESMGCMEEDYDKLIQIFTDEVNKLKTSIKYIRVYGQKYSD